MRIALPAKKLCWFPHLVILKRNKLASIYLAEYNIVEYVYNFVLSRKVIMLFVLFSTGLLIIV